MRACGAFILPDQNTAGKLGALHSRVFNHHMPMCLNLQALGARESIYKPDGMLLAYAVSVPSAYKADT